MSEALERWAMEHVDDDQPEERREIVVRERAKAEEDRTRTIRWYLSNVTMEEIARRLGSDVRTVQRDLAHVRREWARQRVVDYNLEMAKQLARIDALEAEAWDQWQVSKEESKQTRGETKTVMTRRGPQPVQSGTVTTFAGKGDAAYLVQIRWCIEERSRLLGLYAPRKLAVAAVPDTGRDDDGAEQSDAGRLIALARAFKQQRAQLGAGGTADAAGGDGPRRATIVPEASGPDG